MTNAPKFPLFCEVCGRNESSDDRAPGATGRDERFTWCDHCDSMRVFVRAGVAAYRLEEQLADIVLRTRTLRNISRNEMMPKKVH